MIQSLFLDILVARLWPILLVLQGSGRQAGIADNYIYTASFLTILIILVALGWLVGIIAIHRRGRRPFVVERLADAPRNGFEVWTDPPMFGLQTPAVLARLVRALGPEVNRRKVAHEYLRCAAYVAIVCSAFVILGAPHHAAAVAPALGTNRARSLTFWGLMALMAVVTLRAWAAEGRKRLEAVSSTSRSNATNVPESA
jgi:hypothetical protein